MSDPEGAEQAFNTWFRESQGVIDEWRALENNGGKTTGSLASLVEKLEKEQRMEFTTISSADPDLVDKAIRIRVAHYLGLFKSVAENGFVRSWKVPITCFRSGPEDDPTYVLKNGHHRVAIMKLLGYATVPTLVLDPRRYPKWLLKRRPCSWQHGPEHSDSPAGDTEDSGAPKEH